MTLGYIINVKRLPLSTDVTLKSIQTNRGVPISVDGTNYTLTINERTTQISIWVETNHPYSSVYGSGEYNIIYGENPPIPITVTAEDGLTKKSINYK